MSPERAAPLIGIIGAQQWRNIESGKSFAKDGVLAHMARVVGIRPERLDEVDRHEAAEILREIIAQTASALPTVEPDEYPDVVGTDPFFRYIWDGPAPEMERRMAIMGVEMYRAASPNAPSERDGRKHA